MSWVEEVLREWGVWLRSKGDGQGWGGSLDMDRLTQSCHIRDPGVHSDPVCGEVIATDHDGQSPLQRVHRHILQLKLHLRLTARLRYAGLLMPMEEGPRTRPRWVPTASETLEGCGHWRFEFGHWEHWGESGPMPVTQIATLMEVGPSTVYARLNTLHETVRRELKQDARNNRANTAPRRFAA